MGFLFAPGQTVKQAIEKPVIWEVIALIMPSLWSFIHVSVDDIDMYIFCHTQLQHNSDV